MAKKPYKFRQARKDAKAAAKKAFPGKVKAVRKDITGKLTAEDRLALKDMADTAKKELGKKAYLSRAEYDAMRNADLEKFRQSMADEFGEYAGKKAGGDDAPAKKAPAKKAAVKKSAAAIEKKAPVKKAAVKKTAVKKTPVKTAAETPAKKATPSKTMTRAEKSAANKAAWAKMTPEERKNWKGTKPGAAETKPATKPESKPAAKTSATKRPTLADLKKNEAKGLEEAKKRVEAKGAATKPAERKKIVVDKKTSTADKPTAGKQAIDKMKADANAKAKAKSSKPKFRRIKAIGKGGVVGAVAGEVVSLAKGSTKKDFDEINRLENKLAQLTGKGKSKLTAARQGAQQQVSQLVSLATLGSDLGKTRRQRMDELNRLIAKAEKANKPKELRYGKDGSSLVPGTAAYKAGSKTKPAYGTTSTGGGSTTKVDSRYTVKKGDTLSGIAKTAGVSLSEIRAANPEIMKKKKYKQGSMIWSGTKVNIPKKK
jgi:LysM repeat protein